MNLDATNAALGDPTSRGNATPPASDVLDVQGLRRRCMGDLDLMQSVLKLFVERMPMELKTIEEALQVRDLEQMARIAHRVRGTSASMSANAIARAAGAIEDAGRQGQLSDLPANVEHLRDEWEKYLICADALLSEAQST